MSDPQIVTNITTPLGEGGLRVARIEYHVFFNMPGGNGGQIKIEGMFEQDLKKEALAIFKLLVENGWISNPVLSRTVFYDQHTSFHAECHDKKPTPPKV